MTWQTWLYVAVTPTCLSWSSVNFNHNFCLHHSPVGHWGEAEEAAPSGPATMVPLSVLWLRLTHHHLPHISPLTSCLILFQVKNHS